MSVSHDLSPARLRRALGRYATGVTVVTAAGADGPIGLTVNSFAPVSLEPPLVLWSLRRASIHYADFTARGGFAIHVLGAPQRDLARVFSQPVADRYAGLDWYATEDGIPVFDACAARFECATRQVLEVGDHAVLIGEVRRLHAPDDHGGALVFHDGSFLSHLGDPVV